jgi:hypothetical protein
MNEFDLSHITYYASRAMALRLRKKSHVIPEKAVSHFASLWIPPSAGMTKNLNLMTVHITRHASRVTRHELRGTYYE